MNLVVLSIYHGSTPAMPYFFEVEVHCIIHSVQNIFKKRTLNQEMEM